MNKIKAIKQARKFILENQQFNDKTNTWETYTAAPGVDVRHDLKNRRVIYALQLIGVDKETAKAYAYANNSKPFRDIIYQFKK